MESLRNDVEEIHIGGCKVGMFFRNITGKLVYETIRRWEKGHFMRKVRGFGIQKEILDRFRLKDPTGIINIIYLGKYRVIHYQSPVSRWLNTGVLSDYGHGEQLMLLADRMEVVESKRREGYAGRSNLPKPSRYRSGGGYTTTAEDKDIP